MFGLRILLSKTCFSVFFFFFFQSAGFFNRKQCIRVLLWTHKYHFLSIFLLKMGLTILFTHLKIILLQYFLIFSFSFQFSVFSCIQMDPY